MSERLAVDVSCLDSNPELVAIEDVGPEWREEKGDHKGQKSRDQDFDHIHNEGKILELCDLQALHRGES